MAAAPLVGAPRHAAMLMGFSGAGLPRRVDLPRPRRVALFEWCSEEDAAELVDRVCVAEAVGPLDATLDAAWAR